MTAAIKLHPSRPLADGIQYDELYEVDEETRELLADRRVVYLTEFKTGGRRFGGNVIAGSWSTAELIAWARGLGEVVVGILIQPERSAP
ncbi:hypothetical protein [Parvibaculum sp.]|uniref:hypothetical protein n=1 Tax=Parvibaculum sp. TaxID=2024848 RepID=UPI003298F592